MAPASQENLHSERCSIAIMCPVFVARDNRWQGCTFSSARLPTRSSQARSGDGWKEAEAIWRTITAQAMRAILFGQRNGTDQTRLSRQDALNRGIVVNS